MYNINEKDTIYFGTKFENLIILDSVGIEKPFIRNEQYIAVSTSGYIGKLSFKLHNDLEYLAHIYANDWQSAKITDNGYLEWKNGYKNSITYIDGFGPNDLDYYNSFGQKITNNRKGKSITAVIDRRYINYLVEPSQDRIIDRIPYEYYSVALHPFIKEISPKMIVGWIVDRFNIDKLKEAMKNKKIQKKMIWSVEELS